MDLNCIKLYFKQVTSNLIVWVEFCLAWIGLIAQSTQIIKFMIYNILCLTADNNIQKP